MPDLDIALETIDIWAEKKISKPNASMTKSQLVCACRQLQAIDILKDHLKAHWYEAPASDLVYHFVREYDKRRTMLKNDPMMQIIYSISKEIFFYFV